MLSDQLTSSKQYREIFFYKSYFIEFYTSQRNDVQKKIEWVLKVIQTIDRVPSKFLKSLESTNGLYEVRIEYESNHIRVFAFFENAHVLILLNGFIKKTRRTPLKELRKAVRIQKDYYDEKS